MQEEPLDQEYWNVRYQENRTAWDLGMESPPLKAYFDELTDRSLKILIPGGGNSYEAEYLMTRGFTNVMVVDISEIVVKNLRQRLARYLDKGLKIIQHDFFAHSGSYDLIVEQTFFCALDPVLRPDYVRHMAELLSQNGKLVGVLFDRDFVGGPPFGGNRAAYRALFEEKLAVLTMEPCYNSVAPRMGSEVFFIAVKPLPI